MPEKILTDLYRIEIPLPNSPLKALNAYLVKGRKRCLLIDTGMNREECLNPMLSSLRSLDVDLNKTDFFITHLHADHSGLVGKLATGTSKVYFSEREASVMESMSEGAESRIQELFDFFLMHGFKENELRKAFNHHPGWLYSSKRHLDLHVLKEDDTLEVGDYAFRCIDTPGHSPGHMCLYDEKNKILVSGDHILFNITPNITRWPDLENALKAYLESLEKVFPLEVELVLPGHRKIWHDHKKRIRELEEHHKNRLNEILAALKEGEKTAWAVAPHITWDIDIKTWEQFPPVQKWFALGETIAHLHYLEAEGSIKRREANGQILFLRT